MKLPAVHQPLPEVSLLRTSIDPDKIDIVVNTISTSIIAAATPF
jgi:hypothetical protein